MRKYKPPEFAHCPRTPSGRATRVQGLRRSGAAGPHHDARSGQIGTRGAARRAAVKASRREN